MSFAYPGTSRVVLDEVSLTLPAGTVVAIVGENGAGKTTLVKLLAKMYEPSSGSILLDDTPLARVPAGEWRARLAGAFQDFFRFEFLARQTVGLGDVASAGRRAGGARAPSTAPAPATWSRACRPASTRSSARRGPAESTFRSASGRSSRWRAASCAMSRCCSSSTNRPRRSTPKPSTRCSSATPAARTFVSRPGSFDCRGESSSGRITILVSHRFSTVRMADLIVVLDGARLVEVGTHEESDGQEGAVRGAV